MDSTNINTNVAQIILPPDMELRKVKKKKPKTSPEKKKVLEKLKQTLKEFDTALSVAGSKNITIPAQLGILPDNITQINSIKELKALTETLQARIQTINQLVAQGAQQQRTAGLFNEGMGSGQRLPSTPGQFPQRQPQIIPQPPFTPAPVQPIPSGTGGVDPTQVPENDAENTLEQLRQEILNKLSPEDRAKAEAELEKERQTPQQPEQPEQPEIPEEPTTPTGSGEPMNPQVPQLETDLGFDIGGGKKIDLKSPPGWTDIYSQYRKYIEGLTQKIVKVDKGIFELPPFEEQQLNEKRNDILDQYDRFIKSLTPQQKAFMDNDPNLKQLDSGMLKELTLDPKDVIREIAKLQGLEITQITDKKTITEEKTAQDENAKQFEQKIKQAFSQFDKIIMEANAAGGLTKKDIIDDQERQVVQILQNITKQYDKLEGKEKVSIESVYQEFRKKALNLMGNVERMKNENIQLDEEGNVIRKIRPQPPAEDAPEGRPEVAGPDIPPAQRLPAGDGTKLNSGKFTIVPVKQSVRGALNKLEELVNNNNKQLTEKREKAVTTILEYDKLEPFLNKPRISTLINDLPPKNPERKASFINIVDNEILKKVLVDVAPE
tara:strand:+ start:128 stop:1945 length:1818 start_codon:yes stop_codon:yes gene_type:complete